MKAISIELYKLRHKRILLMVILFLLVEVGWALTVTSNSIARNPDQATWEPLIAMISSMNGLFFPILTAVCVSRICDMEHKGNTLKMLLTLSLGRNSLYAAKFIAASIVILFACLLQVVAITAFGIIKEFEQSIPLFLLTRYFIGTALESMVIIALQQWISMGFKNQAFALTIGMIGGFIGLTADLLPFDIRRIFVWSYYTGLSPVTQSYTSEELQFIVRDLNSTMPMMLALIVIGAVIYFVGSLHLAKKEV